MSDIEVVKRIKIKNKEGYNLHKIFSCPALICSNRPIRFPIKNKIYIFKYLVDIIIGHVYFISIQYDRYNIILHEHKKVS